MAEKAPLLTDVHAALKKATFVDALRMKPTSIKIRPEVKACAEAICKRNNTTLPAFWRECANGLIRDYSPDSAKALGIE